MRVIEMGRDLVLVQKLVVAVRLAETHELELGLVNAAELRGLVLKLELEKDGIQMLEFEQVQARNELHELALAEHQVQMKRQAVKMKLKFRSFLV